MSADATVDKEGCDLDEWRLYFSSESVPPPSFYEGGLSILFWRRALYGLANNVLEERASLAFEMA